MSKRSKISYIADKTGNSSDWTVTQMLQDALADETIIDGTFDKAVLIKLNDKNGDYHVGFSQAGLSMSECLALADIAKDLFKEQMGY